MAEMVRIREYWPMQYEINYVIGDVEILHTCTFKWLVSCYASGGWVAYLCFTYNLIHASETYRAIRLLLIMGGILTVTLLGTYFGYTPEDEKGLDDKSKVSAAQSKLHAEFDSFRRQYIGVYLVIMLADWMQGTHMYTLYLSYGVNISALFLTGFLSGAIFAPFLGSAVDKFGRKKSCIVYCVLEIIINTLEHSTNFRLLLLGRVLGGISTNLLFSAFESWMTTEHRHRGFPEAWLARTYSAVSQLN